MGTATFGKYEIQRELGRGAMGIVYEAHDPSRGADVALKVMTVPANATAHARRRQVERFYREARALSELSHPNVVRIFDRGELGGRYFLSMELVRGTTLRDRLQFQGALSLPELVRLALHNDSRDNVTCVVIAVDGLPDEPRGAASADRP